MNFESKLNRLCAQVIRCEACPRLVRYRRKVAEEKKKEFQDWTYWGRPLPGFGDRNGQLLILGLAPAAHGGNRTGRMFTGDSSGSFLTAALYRAGFANQPFSQHRDDGLELRNAYVTASVRCVPPNNKPTRKEMERCSSFLGAELDLLPNIRVVLVLGSIAFQSYVAILKRKGYHASGIGFRHGASIRISNELPRLVCSYHPSRRNTQTGLLTNEMFDDIFRGIKLLIEKYE